MKQLQDIVYKNARQKKYQRQQQQKKAEKHAISPVEEIPETNPELCRSANEQPTGKQKLKPNCIEPRNKQRPTVTASVHRQVVTISNKVALNKKITLAKSPASSDRCLAKITLAQQAICSSVDRIM